MITISGLPRALSCDGSLVFPRAETHNPWADEGTDEHEELARKTLSNTLDPRLARIVPANPRVEVTVAINVATGACRIVGEGRGRNYTPDPLEVWGTIDVLGVTQDSLGPIVVVIDWKTGFNDSDPAERNWQLWGYALAASRALGIQRARVHIAYTNQPGQPIDSHELDWEDLASFAIRVTELVPRQARLRAEYRGGAVPTTREGSWCRHCPSKHVCPSKQGLLAVVASGGLPAPAELSKAQAAEAVRQVLKLEQLVKDARGRLNQYVDDNGPIDMGNGMAYGRAPRSGNRSIDPEKALQAVRESLGPEMAREFEALAFERKTTQVALKRAAQTLGVGKSAEAFKKMIMRRLEELDGITYGREQMPIGEFPIGKVAGSLAERASSGSQEKEVDALLAAAE